MIGQGAPQVGGIGQASSGPAPHRAAPSGAAADPASRDTGAGVGTLPTSQPWFCAFHRAHLGGQTRRDLRRAGCEVHWPRYLDRPRRDHDRLVPLFPGYLFVQVPRDAHWRLILDAPDVLRVLGVRERGEPWPVPPGFVEALIGLAGAIDLPVDLTGYDGKGPITVPTDLKPAPPVSAGAEVTITEGPMTSFPAIVQEVLRAETGEERVKVLVQIFGRSTSAEVPRAHVRAL